VVREIFEPALPHKKQKDTLIGVYQFPLFWSSPEGRQTIGNEILYDLTQLFSTCHYVPCYASFVVESSRKKYINSSLTLEYRCPRGTGESITVKSLKTISQIISVVAFAHIPKRHVN